MPTPDDIPEIVSLEWLGRSMPDEQSKTYSADQLGALSKLPSEVVERLSMFGLIEARNGRYGFRQITARGGKWLLAADLLCRAVGSHR